MIGRFFRSMPSLLAKHEIRTLFSRTMSEMYQKEVPLYGKLLSMAQETNSALFAKHPQLATVGITRLTEERHGAIRLGTAKELQMIKRLFAVMGMSPVGYYDLTVANLPIHSTAFRPIEKAELDKNPFRIFTSLLIEDLLPDDIKSETTEILEKRYGKIFPNKLIDLIKHAETQKGLTEEEAEEFVNEAIKVFKWHQQANISQELYKKLSRHNKLIPDIVFGPHVNHLTPRVLHIEKIHKQMIKENVVTIPYIQGPPKRFIDILLRQTSCQALQEAILFSDNNGELVVGHHTARFCEFEQRGVALTRKGRALYDEILATVIEETAYIEKAIKQKVSKIKKIEGQNYTEEQKQEINNIQAKYAERYYQVLEKQFKQFSDSYEELRKQELAYFTYERTDKAIEPGKNLPNDIEELIKQGYAKAVPITYEDFLPVSAAGIFISNLGNEAKGELEDKQPDDKTENYKKFVAALGEKPLDPFELYEKQQKKSLEQLLENLRIEKQACVKSVVTSGYEKKMF